MPRFNNLVSGNLTYVGPDQGIDFTGSGAVHALGPGRVTRVERGTFRFKEGVGSIITYVITGGPLAGKSVYTMEAINVPTSLKVGSTLQQGQVIGTVNSKYPGIETGWANANGGPLFPLGSTNGGEDFGKAVDTLAAGGKGAGAAAGKWGHPQQTPTPGSGTGGVTGAVTGAAGDVGHAVAAPFEAVGSVADFLGKLADPNLWLRGLQMIAGAGLAFAGLLLLARQIGLQPPLEAPPVAKAAASVVE